MSGCRRLLDASQPNQRLRNLWPDCETRIGSILGSDRFCGRVDVGTSPGTAGDLPPPAIPRREATVEEVAPPGLVGRGGDRLGKPGHRTLSWATDGPRGRTQPLWARADPLDSERGTKRYPAAPGVHASRSYKLGVALPAIQRGGARANQVLAFAAMILGLGFSSFVIPSLLLSSDDAGGDNPLWENLAEDAVVLSFVGVPVAVGIAILRYRLYEIDILINRALVYGSLTATLVALYFGGIVVSQRFFVLLTGQQATLAVVASTLLIAALFNPLRRRIQSFIDRRFYRRKYDAAKTLEDFSAKLRDETDLDALSGDLVRVVGETMQPAHVSLWLRPETSSKGEQ